MSKVSIELIQEYFSYEPNTGILRWKKSSQARIKVGDIAGSNHSGKGLRVHFLGEKFMVHRIIWACFYGKWPQYWLDHKDGNPFNNKLDNLRETTASQNSANSDWGLGKGVQKIAGYDRYRARIRFEGKLIHIGYFSNEQEAKSAYLVKAKELFKEFTRA